MRAARIGIRELRDDLTGTIRRVRTGETFVVTHHGEPVALLAPLPDDPVERLVRSGAAVRAHAPLDLRALRPRRASGQLSASEALAEDRDARQA